ncbi:hypothetical protein A3K63_02115 [Candidatus Micrarchaeota archaeon RBG_16_49_10]|nr:MAG: hypothetical protein A3K63_02115 [Candidatus Micrarchaeota archaeon RBG_16_49_10]
MGEGLFSRIDRLFYFGLKPELVDVVRGLHYEDRVRVTSNDSQLEAGYLSEPSFFSILFHYTRARDEQGYRIWYDQLEKIEKLG